MTRTVLRKVGTRRVLAGVLTSALAASLAVVSLGAPPAGAEVTAVDGGASGAEVGVSLLGSSTTLAATPSVSLPSDGGGPFTDSVASVALPGVLSTGVLDVSTQGGNLNSHSGFSTSSASVADVNVLAGLVTADVVATACTSNGDGSTGATTLTGASVSGLGALAVSPAPNTTISLPGVATITLNEQVRNDVAGSISTITVSAIHVQLLGVLASGDIYVARSMCQVTGPDVLNEPPTTPTTTTPADPPAPGDTPTATPTTPTTTATPATPVTGTPNFTG